MTTANRINIISFIKLFLLDERSIDILQSRYLKEEKLTLHTLADKYGVSAERVRQLENKAIKKLKERLEE